jgi:histidyl-tRNA synthetase
MDAGGLEAAARRKPDRSTPSISDRIEMLLANCRSGLNRAVKVDPEIVRGLDYYTRTVFEVHYPELGSRSALCGGGRYDHLLRDLGGPDLGAVGFAIGFTATMIALAELGLTPAVGNDAPAAFVVQADPGLSRDVFLLAEELRAGGVSAVFDTEGKSLKAQMKAAGKGGHRLAIVLGPDEVERGVVQLKDLGTGDQRAVPRAEIVAASRALLGLAQPGAPDARAAIGGKGPGST